MSENIAVDITKICYSCDKTKYKFIDFLPICEQCVKTKTINCDICNIKLHNEYNDYGVSILNASICAKCRRIFCDDKWCSHRTFTYDYCIKCAINNEYTNMTKERFRNIADSILIGDNMTTKSANKH